MSNVRNPRLPGIKTGKQTTLNRILGHTMNTVTTLTDFTFTSTALGATAVTVPKQIAIKTKITVTVGTQLGVKAVDFFTSIGCYSPANTTIDMFKLNKIKQYLDMIKDGTSSNLLKKLKVFDPAIISNVTYPNTLDAIKEYFNQHYTMEGKMNKLFWPRHGEYKAYLRDDEIAFHDCGFKPDLCIVKGPPDYIDPLAHGPFQPATDLVYPSSGKTITWSSETLQAVGFPPECEIKAKNKAVGGSPPIWEVEIICQYQLSTSKNHVAAGVRPKWDPW